MSGQHDIVPAKVVRELQAYATSHGAPDMIVEGLIGSLQMRGYLRVPITAAEASRIAHNALGDLNEPRVPSDVRMLEEAIVELEAVLRRLRRIAACTASHRSPDPIV